MKNPTARGTRQATPIPWEADGPDLSKRDVIAKAAEALFARGSFESVSIRDVAARAGVTHGLVRYYFGSKKELYQSLFARRYHEITQERFSGLDAIPDTVQGIEAIAQIFSVWFRPILELTNDRDQESFALLLVRETEDSEFDKHGIHKKYLDPAARVCISRLARAVPHADPAAIARGYIWAMDALMSTVRGLSRLKRLSGAAHASRDMDLLVRYASHGFAALCASPAPAAPPAGPARQARAKASRRLPAKA